MGAILADGWYSGYVGFGKKRDHYGKQAPRAGASSTSSTPTARARHRHRTRLEGRHRPDPRGRLPHGRGYDARKELAGWDTPGFDEAQWDQVDSAPS